MGYFINYSINSKTYCDQSSDCGDIDDIESRIICKEVEILDCGDGDGCDLAVVNNGLILCSCDTSFNCNLCGNDLPYWSPVLDDDILVFQFQQIDNFNGQDPNGSFPYGWGASGFANGFVKDCCSDQYILSGGNPKSVTNYATQSFVGVYPVYDYAGNVTWKNIQQIEIDLKQLYIDLNAQFPNGGGCFVFEWIFNAANPVSKYSFCSEPYKFDPCPDKSETFLLEGNYKTTDCFKYYYGDEFVGNGTPFTYYNQYRLPGFIEQTSFEISKEFVGTRLTTVSSEVIEKWTLKSKRIPRQIAKILTNILAAKNVYVNGVEYISDGEIPKNNEVGNQWFVEAQLRKINCSKTLAC